MSFVPCPALFFCDDALESQLVLMAICLELRIYENRGEYKGFHADFESIY